MNNYEGWKTIKRGGCQYLALTQRGGQKVNVYDAKMGFYGSYHSIDSFDDFLKRYGKDGLVLAPVVSSF